MSETPKERVLNSLLFLTRAELLEIHDKINTLLISNIDSGDAVKNYFRLMKNEGNILEAIKQYKEKAGCGLKEAKEYIDNL
jgi:hypothetical protein